MNRAEPSRTADIGVAIVGLGFGAIHAAAFRRDPRSRVVALCGRDAQRTAELSAGLRVPRSITDFNRVLDDDQVDLVSLAVPPSTQVQLAGAALAASKHVFLEKPLAASLHAAEQLAELAGRYDRVAAINFEFAELPAFREAKRRIEGGSLGPLRQVAVTWRVENYANKVHASGWKTRTSDGGGALNLFGSHCLYYLEWLLGPMRSMWATLDRAPTDKREGETQCTMVMHTDSGIPVSVSIATDAFLGCGHRVEVYGEEGTLVLENRTADYLAGFGLFVAGRGDAQLRRLETDLSCGAEGEDGRIGTTAAIIRRVLDAITSDTKKCPTPGIAEGVRVQVLLECARKSSAQRCRLEVPCEPHGRK